MLLEVLTLNILFWQKNRLVFQLSNDNVKTHSIHVCHRQAYTGVSRQNAHWDPADFCQTASTAELLHTVPTKLNKVKWRNLFTS